MYGSCCNGWCFPAMTSAFFSNHLTPHLSFISSLVQFKRRRTGNGQTPFILMFGWPNHDLQPTTEGWFITICASVLISHFYMSQDFLTAFIIDFIGELYSAVLSWYLSTYITNTAVVIPHTNRTGPTQINVFWCKSYCITAIALVNNICRLLEVLFVVLIFNHHCSEQADFIVQPILVIRWGSG